MERAVKEVKKYSKKIVIMQCNTNYTAEAKNNSYLNLKVLNAYKKIWKIAILGLSDHTFGHNSVLGAVALGQGSSKSILQMITIAQVQTISFQ